MRVEGVRYEDSIIHAYHKIFATKGVVSTSLASNDLHSAVVVRTFQTYSLSHFRAHNTVVFVPVTVLCVRSPELTHDTGSRYPLTHVFLSAPRPRQGPMMSPLSASGSSAPLASTHTFNPTGFVFLCLIPGNTTPSKSIHVDKRQDLLLDETTRIGNIPRVSSPIRSWVRIWGPSLSCLRISATVNGAATDTGVHIFSAISDFIFFK